MTGWAQALSPAAWGLLGCVLGAVAGSYLATLAVRWPRGRATRGRSMCDGCGCALRPFELVPLVSWVAVRGRCVRCDAAIDPRHPAMEALCAAMGATALVLAPGPAGVAGALFGWLLLTLALLDLDHFWLPDRLTGALAAVGVAGALVGLDPSWGQRFAGGAIGYASLRLIAATYRRSRGREGLGAGDAKLLGAIGLTLGGYALPLVLLGASLLGLLVVAGLRGVGRGPAAGGPVPFGAPLAAAAIMLWIARAAGLAPA